MRDITIIICVLIIGVAIVMAFNPSMIDNAKDRIDETVGSNVTDNLDNIGNNDGNNNENSRIRNITINENDMGKHYIIINFKKFEKELILKYNTENFLNSRENLVRRNDTKEKLFVGDTTGTYSVKFLNQWEEYNNGNYESGTDLVLGFKLNVTKENLKKNNNLEAFEVTTGSK